MHRFYLHPKGGEYTREKVIGGLRRILLPQIEGNEGDAEKVKGHP